MEIGIVTSGYLPVPPTKGGAVENLIFNLIKENEKQRENKFVVYSIYDKIINKYSMTNIVYIKPSFLSRFIDKIVYFISKNILHKKHLISYKYIFQRFSFYKKVAKIINKKRHDKIILENNVVMFKVFHYKDNFKLYENKIYYHAHNELGKTLGYEKDFKFCKKIISVSNFIENSYKSFTSSYNIKYYTLLNTVDSSIFKKNITTSEKQNLKEKYHIDNGNITILFAGRISREKGVLELLNSLKRLDYDYNLVIVGNSFYNTNLKDDYLKELKTISDELKGNIIFTGYVDYQEMYEYYQLCDVCVLPSIWNDPCPLTVIECIMSGTPLITTNVGGIPEIVRKCTKVIDVNSITEEIANALKMCMNNIEAKKKECSEYRNTYNSLEEYYKGFIDCIID